MKQNQSYQYSAFISYRHVARDRKWAEWLVQALETYRIPKELLKAGYPARLGKVFRDRDELPSSGSLNGQIESALRASRYLIVICSPETPSSRWVSREIELFKELGRADKIIPLLVEGEPKDSFPKVLTTTKLIGFDEANANPPIPDWEPIGADVRPVPGQNEKKIKRTERLRLMASMMGCSFDDLNQRDKQRELAQRRGRVCVISAIATLAAFATWTFQAQHKKEIQAQHQAEVVSSAVADARQLLFVDEKPKLREGLIKTLVGYVLAGDPRVRALMLDVLVHLDHLPESSIELPRKVSILDEFIASSDGRFRLFARGDKVDVLSAEDGSLVCSWRGQHLKKIANLNAHSVVVQTTKTQLTVVNIYNCEALSTYSVSGKEIAAFATDSESHSLVIATSDGRLWRRNSRQSFDFLNISKPVLGISSMTICRGAQLVGVGTDTGKVFVFDLGQLQKAHEFQIAQYGVYGERLKPIVDEVLFSSDCNFFAGRNRQSLLVADLVRGKRFVYRPEGKEIWIGRFSFSLDGKALAFSNENKVHFFDLDNFKMQLREFPAASDISHIGFDNQRETVFAVSGSEMWSWSLTGYVLGRTAGNDSIKRTSALAVGSSGFVVSGDREGTVRFWDVNTGEAISIASGFHQEEVNFLSFNLDGSLLVSSAENVVVWDVKKVLRKPTVSGGWGAVDGVTEVLPELGDFWGPSFSSDSKRIEIRSENMGLKTVEIQSKKVSGTIETVYENMDLELVGHASNGFLVGTYESDKEVGLAIVDRRDFGLHGMYPGVTDFCEDNCVYVDLAKNKIAMVSSDMEKLIISTPVKGTYKEFPIETSESGISSIAFSPDGETLVAGDDDGYIRFWDVKSGTPIGKKISRHKGSVEKISFSDDGKTLVTGDSYGELTFFPGQELWPALICRKLGKEVTEEEWKKFISETIPYRKLC